MKTIDRIIKFHDYLKNEKEYGGRNKLEEQIGKSAGYLSKALEKGSTVGDDVINALVTLFPHLSLDWLLTGEGQMLKNDGSNGCITNNLYTRPHIDSEYASCGNPNGFETVIMRYDCDSFSLPYVGEYDFSVQARGDSMINRTNPTRSIKNKDIVACKHWKGKDYTRWGEVYALATSEGIVIKKILPSEKEGYVRCVSFNEEENYLPYDIPLEDISDWALVVGVVHIDTW